MNVHRFFGSMLPALPGTPPRDLTPDEHTAAVMVHGEEAVHTRWTRAAHAPPIVPPAAPPAEET